MRIRLAWSGLPVEALFSKPCALDLKRLAASETDTGLTRTRFARVLVTAQKLLCLIDVNHMQDIMRQSTYWAEHFPEKASWDITLDLKESFS